MDVKNKDDGESLSNKIAEAKVAENLLVSNKDIADMLIKSDDIVAKNLEMHNREVFLSDKEVAERLVESNRELAHRLEISNEVIAARLSESNRELAVHLAGATRELSAALLVSNEHVAKQLARRLEISNEVIAVRLANSTRELAVDLVTSNERLARNLADADRETALVLKDRQDEAMAIQVVWFGKLRSWYLISIGINLLMLMILFVITVAFFSIR